MMKLLLIIFTLLLTACGGKHSSAPIGDYGSIFGKASSSSASKAKRHVLKAPSSYKVKRGDTLYSISWRYGMDYKTLAKINGIKSPYKIFVGQKLVFKSKYASSSKKKKTTKKTSKKTKKVVARSSNSYLKWRWPTKGKVISTYSKSATGRKGIDISGKVGQAVYASAAGKVVYSGNGLPRYGNLLIIKHNDVYLSAYAHNSTLLFKEGQKVKAGQKVATMGNTGTQKPQLHFEIRRNGKPVDPMRFLPKR